MNKTIVALDIDDVLAGFTDSVRLRVNELTGLEIAEEAYRIRADYWGYYERVWESHPLTKDQSIVPLIAEMAEDHRRVPLLAGAEFGLRQLAQQFQLVFITARPEIMQASTVEWLKHHFSDVPADVHFTNHTKSDEPTVTKGEICKRLGARYLIDDNVEHCVSAIANGVIPVLFGEYGWQHTFPEGIVRCKDWPAVVEYFGSEAER